MSDAVELSGIAIGNATAIFGGIVAVLGYVLKLWWEDNRRFAQKREDAYLRLGSAAQKLEVAVLFDEEDKLRALFEELIEKSTDFHFFASGKSNKAVTEYFTALGEIIATAESQSERLVERMQHLNGLRTAAGNAMRQDVLAWSSYGMAEKLQTKWPFRKDSKP